MIALLLSLFDAIAALDPRGLGARLFEALCQHFPDVLTDGTGAPGARARFQKALVALGAVDARRVAYQVIRRVAGVGPLAARHFDDGVAHALGAGNPDAWAEPDPRRLDELWRASDVDVLHVIVRGARHARHGWPRGLADVYRDVRFDSLRAALAFWLADTALEADVLRVWLLRESAGPMVHELKCDPEPFEAVRQGLKPFEVRRADRPFLVGDTLRLREWIADAACYPGDGEPGRYTGREVGAEVSYLLRGYNLPSGLVVMGLRRVGALGAPLLPPAADDAVSTLINAAGAVVADAVDMPLSAHCSVRSSLVESLRGAVDGALVALMRAEKGARS